MKGGRDRERENWTRGSGGKEKKEGGRDRVSERERESTGKERGRKKGKEGGR